MNETRKITSKINIEGAKLIYKNFQGKGSTYNKEGQQNFSVILEEDLAEQLLNDGWNVKRIKPREDDPEDFIGTPYLNVKVRFDKFPPIAVLITERGKKKLTKRTIGQLDWSRILNCDLIISPYNYPATPGRPAGVTAYLQAIYVTLEENDFEKKYADLRDLDEEEYDEEN